MESRGVRTLRHTGGTATFSRFGVKVEEQDFQMSNESEMTAAPPQFHDWRRKFQSSRQTLHDTTRFQLDKINPDDVNEAAH